MSDLTPGWWLRVCALVLAVAALLLPSSTPASSSGSETSAAWPAPTIVRGADRYVTGRASDAGVVTLEQRVLGGWRAVSTASTGADGAYRFRIPTWWVGTRSYRVRSDTAATTEFRASVVPSYTPRGRVGQYRYSFDSMTRWDPCTTIGFRVNARQGGAGAVRDTKAAVARISQATGFRFAYRGTTTGIPSNGGNSWYPADTEIVVAWARPSQSSLLRMYPRAAGVGAALARTGYYNGDGSRTSKISKGMVVVNSNVRMKGGFGTGLTRGDTLMHEIGHAMGLSHSGASAQMMYAYLTRSAARFGRGDLHGLEARGSKLGCVRPTSPATSARGTRTVAPRVAALRVAP
ncbi:matrixin family metalloprotease [Nocardioides guangzhouensis]|uniref:Matrixin family metalloprotease n=1 Tax=Nocardioides guangzhouensis TaxID=2497878 RepID=A0A4Q4ZCZ9_9ACTN|nr:matrixin family metalloprotease [Nocardioides guangzhouensis]RYP85054.1 matrixin family metalloprotease [Nocardioides guangzhouensis]